MRANRPIGLISREYIPIECIHNCGALFGSTCFGKSGGISSLPADCRRYADQLCVELNNRFPLNTAAACPFSMYRLNCRFQLKTSCAPIFGRLCEIALRLFYYRERPQFRILLGKRNVTAILIAPGGAPRFTVEHERQQSLNLCFARHLLKKNSREPDGFFGETAAVLIGARHVVPANAKRSVNRFKDRIQPPPECTSLRHFETDTAVTDLGLRTRQTLSHSFGRNQESTGDADGIEAQNSLQHERRMHSRIDRRVRADDEQFESLVGIVRFQRVLR